MANHLFLRLEPGYIGVNDMSDTAWKILTRPKKNNKVFSSIDALTIFRRSQNMGESMRKINSNLINRMSKMALTNAYLISPWQNATFLLFIVGLRPPWSRKKIKNILLLFCSAHFGMSHSEQWPREWMDSISVWISHGKWYETTEIGLINYAVYDCRNGWKCDHILQSRRRWKRCIRRGENIAGEAEIGVGTNCACLVGNVCGGRS